MVVGVHVGNAGDSRSQKLSRRECVSACCLAVNIYFDVFELLYDLVVTVDTYLNAPCSHSYCTVLDCQGRDHGGRPKVSPR